jgi:hypothetical protein
MKHFYLILFLVVTQLSLAQSEFDLSYHLPKNVTYNPDVPTPQSVFGFNVGEWHISHDKLVEYMKTVANSTNRIAIEYTGKTFESRPLLLLTVTSEANHKNIELIRQKHLQLSDANLSSSLNVNAMPVVVYQGFSVHGNEPSGASAAVLLTYYLAAAQGDAIENMLNNTIILVDPVLNPDGLQRFAYWANTNKSANLNTDSNDREFSEVWPGGRTNHYWFDLNRDWLPVQLPESRARIKSFHNWKPNILTDHHEMGSNSTFFFQPGVPSRVHPFTPVKNQQLTQEIGMYHAKALDKIGSFYFTEENFDDFYYGKGSTFPDINGGVGILFEQASSRGHARETENGILTFPFTIRNQFVTALSTLEAAQNMREKLLNYQRDFYKNAKNEADKSGVKAIVFGSNKDLAKSYHLAEIMEQHNIKLHRLKSDITENGYTFKKETSYVVPTNQQNSKIIAAMFDKRTQFTDSLFYDISAWTFPLAFNLNYAELKSTTNLGETIEKVTLPNGMVSKKSDYGYLMSWEEYYAPKALNLILKQGLRAKTAMKRFAMDGQQFEYGTILIPVQNQNLNENELFNFLTDVAKKSNISFQAVSTGITDGIDLGSGNFQIIDNKKVALIVGDGVSSYDAGEIWHLFDQRYQMNITKLDQNNLSRANISKYTTIILPSFNLNLSDNTLEKLKNWVRGGGVLIGYKNAVKWLSNNKFIKLEYNEPKVEAKNVTFEQRSDFSGAQVIGGAIFEAKLDRSHPINFGYESNTLPLFRRTKLFVKPNESSFNNPIQYTNNPLLSGYISKPNLEMLKNTVPFQAQRLGSGRVIVFTDNTNFRAFWFGTNKLLMNAVFFANAM